MVYLTSLLLMGVVASLGWIGIYPGTVLVSFALPLLWGERRWFALLTYAVVFPAAVAVLFAYGLKVHFDPGVLDLGFP
jgi:putative tricarboxylic transport membrane protein